MNDENALNILLLYLYGIVTGLIRLGLLVRGGISAGQLFHSGFVAYGPALTRAYKLEDEYAKMPRIILEPSIAQAWGQGPSVQNKDGSLIGYQKIWRKDLDGYSFYDFLQSVFNMSGIIIYGKHVDSMLAPYRELIIRGLKDYEQNETVLSKYRAKYFNDVLSVERIKNFSSWRGS